MSIDRHGILPTGKRVLIPHGSVVKYPGTWGSGFRFRSTLSAESVGLQIFICILLLFLQYKIYQRQASGSGHKKGIVAKFARARNDNPCNQIDLDWDRWDLSAHIAHMTCSRFSHMM